MKCVNCENKADYTCADPGVNPVDYCATCLPIWLRDRAARGDFPLREATPAKKSAKKEPKEETKVAEEE
jgi:hypothetical protein